MTYYVEDTDQKGDRFLVITTLSGTIIGQSHDRVRDVQIRKTVSKPDNRPKPDDLAPTERLLEITKEVRPRGTARYVAGDAIAYYSGSLSEGPITVPFWFPSVRSQLVNEAIIDALMKLKDQRFNAGVAMAEANGLADMLTDFAHGVHDVRSAFNKKDWKRAYEKFRERFSSGKSWSEWKDRYGKSLNRAQRASSVPQSWLYYHFGLKPTINDIDGAHKELVRDMTSHPSFATTVVRGRAKYVESRVVPEYYMNHFLSGRQKILQRESVDVRIRVSPTSEMLALLSTAGATNPPEALWNRLPGSFLVDYVFSVGDYLSVLDAGMGYQFGTYDYTFRRIREAAIRKGDWNKDSYPFREKFSLDCSDAVYSEKYLERRVVNNLYPPMYDILPRLKLKGLSMEKLANGLSLLAGAFGKGPFKLKYG
jgi:hypothetical protein